MPVPRVGFFASNAGFNGVKRRNYENAGTVMVRTDCIQCYFGALMIGCTITG